MRPLKERLEIDATHCGKYHQPSETSGEALSLINTLEFQRDGFWDALEAIFCLSDSEMCDGGTVRDIAKEALLNFETRDKE